MDKNSKQLFKQLRLEGFHPLLNYLMPYRKGMSLSVLSGILHHLLGIIGPALGAYLVGVAVIGGKKEQILPYLPILGILVTARIVMYYSDMWFAHEVAFRILVDFRIKLYNAIERVAPAYLLKQRSGELAATLMADVEVLEWFFAHTAGAFLVAVAVPLITLGMMFTMHWILPLILLPFIFILFSIPFWFKKKADQQGVETRERLAAVHGEAIDGIQGLREIVSFNHKSGYTARLSRYSESLYESLLAYGKRMGVEGAYLNGVSSLAMVSILVVSALLVVQGSLNKQWLPVIMILAANIFSPILEVAAMGRNFSIILAAAKRVAAVLETEETVKDTGKIQLNKSNELKIAFHDVDFTYGKELPLVLNKASFQVNHGETVALVGESGVGKTTCINLLQRFWDVTGGKITIEGTDIRSLSLDSLRSLITVVPQEIYLFNLSIRENIRMGNPKATDEEVEKAAKAAHIHEFIMGLPEGYDTNAGERGLKMSGGQRQRLAIARAFLKDSPILILDEALSSLDTENERLLQQSLNDLRKGKTTLIVAHRLSTFKEADRLVVLQDGKVTETGNHTSLVQRKGYYYDLINAQIASVAV
ncbi:ABC transporter ATP-binding protein [Geosporobacter ferrireducens]|uniref:ABC transporter n=1 Tax=Geosporobacter ferrireducens TaxID=1424294 RepID=A0A1D8GL52_9FIRM|nr:ABC transporter ATP-binding protein [Geosporobacter ferrireducens]AOT71630.1 ABC transporter [Geosporobacter ferrireducens]MTI55395.1 ABC transporter ATP-binding protein [Geosporobacter ferrireducens]